MHGGIVSRTFAITTRVFDINRSFWHARIRYKNRRWVDESPRRAAGLTRGAGSPYIVHRLGSSPLQRWMTNGP